MKTLIGSCLLFLSFLSSASDQTELNQYVLSHLLENETRSYTHGVDFPFSSDPMTKVVSRLNFQKYSTVIANLHEEVEKETDIVYLVNTSDKETSCLNASDLIIPKQHMMMLKRTSPHQPLFLRDARGKILGLDPQGSQVATLKHSDEKIDYKSSPKFLSLSEIEMLSQTPFIPVSTGIASGNKILTYSGIFRVNERRTNDMRKSTNTAADPMQWSVYISADYNDGREARLALHGTSERAWGHLGKQRASSGCIRLQSNFSKWNQDLLFSRASDGQLIPRPELSGPVKLWNRIDYVPPTIEKFNKLPKGQKLKVLVVFFDGYNTSCI